MLKHLFTLVISLACLTHIFGQSKYFIAFTDKKDCGYTIETPEKYLSSASLQRRTKQNIAIEENDLPVSLEYKKQIEEKGAKILLSLKWHNGVVVEAKHRKVINSIKQLDFVDTLFQVFDHNAKASITPNEETYAAFSATHDKADYYNYGSATNQVKMVKGHALHNKGYRGKGLTIDVLDGGFYKVNTLPAFDSLWANNRIIFTKDVVDPTSNIYNEHTHGMLVLSVLGANNSGQLVGTSPEANYALIRCEDTNSEQLIEEYYWAAAAEIADSIGADIISSSLGYNNYDVANQKINYEQLDGKTTAIAQSASIAASKGMVVVISAGNEATTSWGHIVTPADALDCLAIGAVDEEGEYLFYSSTGPTADGRIKPDVAAQGSNTAVQAANGEVGTVDGTSVSAPIVSGLIACLWQALPHLTSKQIIEIIRQSGSISGNPDNKIGYGIPDFAKAFEQNKKEEEEESK